MGVYEFVLGIIIVTTAGGLIRAKMGAGRSRGEPSGEAAQLRDEVTRLRDRLAVLERITVEKENSLEREIEQLRDR